MDLKLINGLEKLICPKGVPHLERMDKPLYRERVVCLTDKSIIFTFGADEVQPGWVSLEGAKKGDRYFDTFVQAGAAIALVLYKKGGDPVTIPPISVNAAWIDPYAVVKSTCDQCYGDGVILCNYDHEHECPDCNGTGFTSTLAIEGVATRSTRINGWLFDDRYLWILSQFAEQVESKIILFGLGDHAMIGAKFDGGFALLISMIEFNKAVG